jgi:hypothetical protein
MTTLVNWKPDEKRFITTSTKKLTQEEFLTKLHAKPRPKEIERLVEALTRMWSKIGASSNCGKCFQGKLHRTIGAHGCCGGCPSLGKDGCIAKPIDCALFTCHNDHFDGFDSQKRAWFEGAITMLSSFAHASGLRKGYYHDGYLRECEHKWTKEELAAATQLTRMAEDVYFY